LRPRFFPTLVKGLFEGFSPETTFAEVLRVREAEFRGGFRLFRFNCAEALVLLDLSDLLDTKPLQHPGLYSVVCREVPLNGHGQIGYRENA